jgi:hypothetical protein
MSWLQKIAAFVARDRRMRRRGERDAPTDPAHGTRESAAGGYVGRAGADEPGDTGTSGAEGRAGGPVDDQTGAGRDS